MPYALSFFNNFLGLILDKIYRLNKCAGEFLFQRENCRPIFGIVLSLVQLQVKFKTGSKNALTKVKLEAILIVVVLTEGAKKNKQMEKPIHDKDLVNPCRRG